MIEIFPSRYQNMAQTALPVTFHGEKKTLEWTTCLDSATAMSTKLTLTLSNFLSKIQTKILKEKIQNVHSRLVLIFFHNYPKQPPNSCPILIHGNFLVGNLPTRHPFFFKSVLLNPVLFTIRQRIPRDSPLTPPLHSRIVRCWLSFAQRARSLGNIFTLSVPMIYSYLIISFKNGAVTSTINSSRSGAVTKAIIPTRHHVMSCHIFMKNQVK